MRAPARTSVVGKERSRVRPSIRAAEAAPLLGVNGLSAGRGETRSPSAMRAPARTSVVGKEPFPRAPLDTRH